MELLKKPEGDIEMVPAVCLAVGWMTGWAFAWWLSVQLKTDFGTLAWSTYGLLVVFTVIAAWEHATYWKHILRINELMHR